MPPHTSRPDSLFEMAYTARDPRQNRRANMSFPPQHEMRPSLIAANSVESWEAPPNSKVFLISHRHPEKLPEVTVTSRGNPWFPAATTRQRPGDFPFNASWGPIPLRWLKSNAALLLSTRMETGFPWGKRCCCAQSWRGLSTVIFPLETSCCEKSDYVETPCCEEAQANDMEKPPGGEPRCLTGEESLLGHSSLAQPAVQCSWICDLSQCLIEQKTTQLRPIYPQNHEK